MNVSLSLQNLFIGYYDKMFNNKPLEARDELTYVLNGMLKKIKKEVTDSKNTSIVLTFLEQNPHKNSAYSKRAKQGTKIMWVIAYNKETKKERWLGRVENRVWHQSGI